MKLFGKYRSAREMYENMSPKELEKVFKHGRPITRRDFLQAGAIGFAATITVPPLLQMLFKAGSAEAAGCASTMPAFMTLNLSGGAAMAANMLPTDTGRQLLPSYSKLGMGQVPIVTQEFGGTQFNSTSGFLAGIQLGGATAPKADVFTNTAAIAIWCSSNNDNADNLFDASGAVMKSGLSGKLLQNLGRVNAEPAGIRQKPALVIPPAPVIVGAGQDIANALGVTGKLSALNNNQQSAIGSLVDLLGNKKCKEMANRAPSAAINGTTELCALTSAATSLNAGLLKNPDSGTNPTADGTVSGSFDNIWKPLNNGARTVQNTTLRNQADNTENVVAAFMAYNVLAGNAATGNLELGGYDYHQNPRANTDNKDFAAGYRVGQILASASALGRACFVMVTSDGSVSTPDGSGAGVDFQADYGQGGGIFCFAYDPVARPDTLNSAGGFDYQVGAFTTNQGADSTSPAGGNAQNDTRPALAAFVNYLSFAGNVGAASTILGSTFSTGQIDMITRIHRKTSV